MNNVTFLIKNHNRHLKRVTNKEKFKRTTNMRPYNMHVVHYYFKI